MAYRIYAELGNTNLHAGIWQDGWVHDCRFTAAPLLSEDAWAEAIRCIVRDAGQPTDGCESVLLCASTPRRTALLEGIRKALRVTPRLLGWDLTLAMPVAYDDPPSFGQDRLLAAFAAAELVGRPCIVIDAGSCITCEAVTPDGEVLPIAVAPGLRPSCSALDQVTPHLAAASEGLDSAEIAAAALPARCTRDSIAQGLHCQLAGLAAALAAAGRRALHTQGEVAVVVTGGDGSLLAELIGPSARLEPLLALSGLRSLDERGSR